jgi:hypothetical protein
VSSVPETAAAVPFVAAAMPAETFSTPAAFGGRMVFGCRDDHLYCVAAHLSVFCDMAFTN